VVDALEQTEAELGAPPPPPLASAAPLRIQARLRAAEKRLISLVPGSKHDTRYARHRFPGLTLREVEDRIARLGAALGRFEGVGARRLARDIFEIRR
jgi:hypothetical protein